MIQNGEMASKNIEKHYPENVFVSRFREVKNLIKWMETTFPEVENSYHKTLWKPMETTFWEVENRIRNTL